MPINAAHGNFREPASDDWDIERRLTGPEYGPADGENEFSLRPRNFDEYVGQDAVKENLSVFIAAARERGDCLDHVLLHGPPGLGKTTLSCIIASELGVNLKITSGPAIEKAGDLAALLTTLNRNDVLFIDEIHRLPRAVEADRYGLYFRHLTVSPVIISDLLAILCDVYFSLICTVSYTCISI